MKRYRDNATPDSTRTPSDLDAAALPGRRPTSPQTARLRRSLLAMALLAAISPAFAQDGAAALQAELAALRATVQQLQAEVRSLQAARTPAPAPALPSTSVVAAAPAGAQAQRTAGASVAPGSPLPARQSVSDSSAGASRLDNQAPPTDPELKGFLGIPGTDTLLRIGGYAKLDAIHDSRPMGDAGQFVTASIPVPREHDAAGNFNMHAQQTRLSFEVRRPSSLGGSMRFYLENDFYGGDRGSYGFHLRQAFGQLGNTYGGYGYSAFMDPDALPDTLDFAGPGGQLFVLQASVHQAFRLSRSSSLTLSLEQPAAEVSTTLADRAIRGTQQLPDLVLAARTEHGWGHLQGGLVARRLGYSDGSRGDRVYGRGVALSGVFNLTDRGGNNDLLMFGSSYGKGIAHFISDTSGAGLDAAVDGQGRLRALEAWGAYAAYTHYWNTAWRSNLVYGVARVQRSGLLADSAFRASDYGALNLIWSPTATLTVGAELLHGRLEQQGGASSRNTRIQGSIQYSFVR